MGHRSVADVLRQMWLHNVPLFVPHVSATWFVSVPQGLHWNALSTAKYIQSLSHSVRHNNTGTVLLCRSHVLATGMQWNTSAKWLCVVLLEFFYMDVTTLLSIASHDYSTWMGPGDASLQEVHDIDCQTVNVFVWIHRQCVWQHECYAHVLLLALLVPCGDIMKSVVRWKVLIP